MTMELLAPAGGPEQLEYAIRFGADAVYLACERFGMRAKATNFKLADLPGVVAYAHERDVKVHLACNVAVHVGEIEELADYLKAAQAAGVDALIIGDLGAAVLAREYAPDVDIHVSTQANITNTQAAKVWHGLGATRVVAARELSLKDLAALKQELPAGMELEAFAHGAMCMAYSGRCLLSDYLNGRSGTRGNCAQSCRWKYALAEAWEPDRWYPIEEDDHGSYLLNAEDICMLEHLGDLEEAGIDSIKIEGRNKKAYYVACVTNAYRQVLDGRPADVLMMELESVSHRPYSTGFYYGPAHQTTGELAYIRKTQWVAQVLGCERLGDASWELHFKCRNKCALGDSFELLTPGEPVCALRFSDLRYDPASRKNVLSDKASPDWQPEAAEPIAVDVADHPAECYYAVVDHAAKPGDIIRKVAE